MEKVDIGKPGDIDHKKILEEHEKKFKEIEKQVKEHKIDPQQLFDWYKEELERKEKQITALRKDNEVLFKTAFKLRKQVIEEKE